MIFSSNEQLARFVASIGPDIRAHLKEFYKRWKTGLKSGLVMRKYARQAESHETTLDNLMYILERQGYMQIIVSPKGVRYIFPPYCNLNKEALQSHVAYKELNLRERRSLDNAIAKAKNLRRKDADDKD